MLSEQTFINAGPLIVNATEGGAEGAALAGFTFNVLLIARAPLQLFQSIQAPILPHLTKMRAEGQADEFHADRRVTLGAIAGVRGGRRRWCCSPSARGSMDLLFGSDVDYGRFGLALDSRRHGPLPRGRDPQPGGARARADETGRCVLGRLRRRVRRLPADPGLGRPRRPGRGRICRGRRASVRTVALGSTGDRSRVADGDGDAHPHLPALRGHLRPPDRDGQRGRSSRSAATRTTSSAAASSARRPTG